VNNTENFSFDMIFRQHLLCGCHIILLKRARGARARARACVCVWRNALCNLHYQMLYCIKSKTEGPQASLCVKIWRSVVFVIAPVSFLYSCPSFEAETWRRTASLALSATDKYYVSDRHIHMYVINQETCGNEIKCQQFSDFTEDIGCVS